jgi:hypothetical protein
MAAAGRVVQHPRLLGVLGADGVQPPHGLVGDVVGEVVELAVLALRDPRVELSWVMIGSYWPAAPVRNPHQWSNPHDIGQWSKGPAAPISWPGVRCHLPNPPVT